MGTTVNQLVQEFLERFAGNDDTSKLAAEFVRVSAIRPGHSDGWKFNREEVHERR